MTKGEKWTLCDIHGISGKGGCESRERAVALTWDHVIILDTFRGQVWTFSHILIGVENT